MAYDEAALLLAVEQPVAHDAATAHLAARRPEQRGLLRRRVAAARRVVRVLARLCGERRAALHGRQPHAVERGLAGHRPDLRLGEVRGGAHDVLRLARAQVARHHRLLRPLRRRLLLAM